MDIPPSTEGVTLSGLRPTDARLKTDSILENSVPDTDAEGATGGNTPISQAKGQNNHTHPGVPAV